ncbi:MAG: FG-GAP-like repeat-containing protein [Parcubacteria group bacterium]
MTSSGALAAGTLTLPFRNQNTALLQGWYYDDWTYHGAVDYGCSCGTEIVAADDGYAISWYQPYIPGGGGYSWGEYVLQYSPSCNCYLLYAHLDHWASFIPRINQATYSSQWVRVTRGQVIGWAGNTGTSACHLHFEVSIGGIYPTGARTDPYHVNSIHSNYPDCNLFSNSSYRWSQCPPITASQTTSCASPGSYVDVAKAADFDGNHKEEFARFYAGPGRWDVALSNGSEFLPLRQWQCGWGVNATSQLVGDVNGDGRADSVVHYNGNGETWWSLSVGSGFGGFTKVGTNLMRNMTNRWLADVNGDRKEDLVGYCNGNWYVALSNGSAFGSQFVATQGHGNGSTTRLMADIDGDRRADAVVFFGGDGSWYCALGQPNGKFNGYVRWAYGHGRGSSAAFLADVNGDGRADALAFWNNVASGWQGKIIAWRSYNGSFQMDNTPRCNNIGTSSQRQLFGDYNADGRDDFGFWYSSSGWWVSLSNGYSYLAPRQW